MKLAFTICFIFLTAVSHAQNKGFDKEAFHSFLLRSFDEIFSEGKIEKLNDYYTDDLQILENGAVWNKDSVIHVINERLGSGQKINRKNTITVLQFDTNGNTAWGSYYNEATVSIDGGAKRKVRWLESAVLTKQKNGWRIKLLHSTRIK